MLAIQYNVLSTHRTAMIAKLMVIFAFLRVHSIVKPVQSNKRFVGGLMGVRADVLLCMETQHAKISLSGIPIGGKLMGTARFSDGEGTQVTIDEPLKGQLSRRFVSISTAEFDRDGDRVYVTVKLPFLIGSQRIVLGRADGDVSC